MKSIVIIILLLIMVFSISACSRSTDINVSTTETETQKTTTVHNPGDLVSDWQVAQQYLMDGNKRFIDNQTITRDTNAADRTILKDGQQPFAIIVTCADSRVSPEIYFDQKLGDIFVIRNAGNIIDETTLGSIEYAVEHLGTPLVVVVGHTNCGAVTGAFNGGEYPENLQSIIDRIHKSIEGSSNLDEAIRKNIENGIKTIKNNEIIEEIGATVLSACYNIETGEVTWLE